MRLTELLFVVAWLWLSTLVVGADDQSSLAPLEGVSASTFQVSEEPHLLLKFCVKCHGPERSEALRMRQLFDRKGYLLPAATDDNGFLLALGLAVSNKGARDIKNEMIWANPDEALDLSRALKMTKVGGRKPFMILDDKETK